MSSVERLVGEFVAEWQAGRRPDVEAYLERAAEAEREELAAQLMTWLEIAPSPQFDTATRAAIDAEPALVAARAAAAEQLESLAVRVAALRERAGLAVRDVSARLGQLLGVTQTSRTTTYLERLERDELDESRLSRRLLEALAATLGTHPDRLAPRGPAPIAAQAFFRADSAVDSIMLADLSVLSNAALSPAPAEPLDEIDRLFLGGPDG